MVGSDWTGIDKDHGIEPMIICKAVILETPTMNIFNSESPENFWEIEDWKILKL